MDNNTIYMEYTAHEQSPLMDDIKEAAGVMAIGCCFIVVFALIMSFLISKTRD